jgi:hypothetical protein
MCMKAPSPKQPPKVPVQYLSNPWLDGLGIGTGRGRATLRNDLGASNAAYVNPYAITPATAPTTGAGVVAPTAPNGGGWSSIPKTPIGRTTG